MAVTPLLASGTIEQALLELELCLKFVGRIPWFVIHNTYNSFVFV